MRISRRQALQVPVVGVIVVAAGCGKPANTAPPPPDPLIALAKQARFDAAQATSTVMLSPDRADALQEIARERRAHSDALEAEVKRLAGTPSPTPTTESQTYHVGLDDVRASLTTSAQAAADAARNTHGYRAGLLASISAACTVQNEVLLG